MIKIAISGKANTGKNTTAEFIVEEYSQYKNKHINYEYVGLADPIKEMVMIMFPHCNRENLFGASHLRSEIIPRAFKDGKPLTYRQILLDLGTEVGRSYNDNIWLENLQYRLQRLELQANAPDMVLITDVRFPNEMLSLKEQGFFLIRIYRENNTNIMHSSELNQDLVSDSEFDYVIFNNKTLADLKDDVGVNIVPKISIM